jgi:gamma-glutamylcyclotransferase (GGCT)/AIG2-like uncharacterized protein YtfP
MPLLFSYGTLQEEGVQLSTFGRRLQGTPDSLVGFVIADIRIEDHDVVVKSGKEYHPIAKASGSSHNHVPGTVFEITDDELMRSDQYEVDAYKRVETTLESGKNAWVYVEVD